MARKPRLHLPGGLYHVMLRGNGGQDIFFAKKDRRRLLELLAEGTARFGFRVHGFCLMTNHLHLVLQAGEEPLARAMQNLSFRYTRFLNARMGRVGHLFQGRYKALLVDGDSYLLELVRYVHLNPVRAGLVKRPADWTWSGHRAYLGKAELPWLTTDWVLERFAGRRDRARAGYAAFVREGLGEGHRPEFHAGAADARVLADDDFLERVLARSGRRRATLKLDDIVAGVCAVYGLEARALGGPTRRRQLSEARGVIALIGRDSGAASLAQLAAAWRRDASTLSRNLRRLEQRQDHDPELARRIEACNNTIIQA